MRIPTSPPPFSPLLEEMQQAGRLSTLQLEHRVGPAPGGRYRHWDKLRYLEPPDGVSHREWWALVKLARETMRRDLPLQDRIGRAAWYTLPDPALKMLARIEREAGGRIALPEEALSPEHRDRYVVSSLIEEAITSSQLEGAATTRRVAKEMLRTGRPAVTKDEQMILNNYQAMRWMRARLDEPLTPAFVLELHRRLTAQTLSPEAAGAFRTSGDAFGVYSGETLVHRPPEAAELPARLEAMCAFANEAAAEGYLPPIVKAVILHFWLAYDHPFEDGNGRTARALFYWYGLKQGFWLFEFISISTILKKAPARYGRSYLYTETDENDLTYFILNQLDVILRALDQLRRYVARKMQEARNVRRTLKPSADLNHRQIALLGHAHRHPGHSYTVASHQTSHGVVYDTARTDLLGLAAKGLLHKEKAGRKYLFRAPDDLAERLQELS